MDKIKYLPIKMIQKRETLDQSYTEAGGGKPPAWMSSINIEERSEMVINTLGEVDTYFNQMSEKKRDIPATIEFTLDARATAKSYRSNIRKIVDVNKKNNIIGIKNDDTLIVKVDDSDDLKEMSNNFKAVRKNAEGLATIRDSKRFKPDISVENNDVLKVKLINYLDTDINAQVEKQFEITCKTLGFLPESVAYTDEIKVYKINFDETTFAVLQEFEGISSIEDMPKIDISIDSFLDCDFDVVPLKEPESGIEYPIVGVLDSGVASNEYTSPWIVDRYTPYIIEDVNDEHGSAVASVLIYGDELAGHEITNGKGCYIYDACIVPKSEMLGSLTESDLIQNIQDAIKRRSDIKIWNLSIGWNQVVSSKKVSDFGSALDYLCDEYNVIICTSIGNCRNFLSYASPDRIQVSADSVRSLAIGSLAHLKREFDQVEINHPSPFSRKGPGPFNLIKPDLTHYGGNAGINPEKHPTFTGVNVINSMGKIIEKPGTSFSTPRVCGLLAALHSEIENYDPLLLKCLLIHSAKYPDVDIDSDEKFQKMGFGMPSSVNEILYNSENEITLVIRDVIEKGSFIEILDFPFPKSMIENGYYYGEISVTLVSSPDLVQSQGEEYCQSNIDVFFGTYDEVVEREGKTIRNPLGKDDNYKNMLNPGLYSKSIIKRNRQFRTERILKSYYQKFQPVKKWVVNLDELSEGNREKYLEYPKLWNLKIEGLFRDHIERITDQINTEFCLIVTIRDTKYDNNIYAEITTELEANNFVQNDINLKSKVRLSS